MQRDPPPPPSRARLFLALWPDDAVRSGLLASQHACRWPAGARPTAPGRLHLTLHFIGAVPRAAVPAFADGLGVAFDGFELALDRVETWPNGVAALCPQDVPASLVGLHERLGDALRRLGRIPEARPFHPHVTLARDARGAVAPGAGLPAVRWHADGYVLAESTEGYRVLERWGAAGRVTR